MKKRKIICAMSCCMFFNICLSNMVTSFANVTDSNYAYVLSSTTPSTYTGTYAKDNSSSTYIKLSQSPSGYAYFSAYGYVTDQKTGGKKWANETVGASKVKIGRGEWLLRQNIFEHGGRSEKLLIQRYQSDGMVAGCWSPDSVGSYTEVN